MARFCGKCGTQMDDSAAFCPACGTPVSGGQGQNYYSTNAANTNIIQKKDIFVIIILSFITCGIYGIIWFIEMTDDANKLYADDFPSGGTAFLFTLLTCGLYSIYWAYKMGQKLHTAGKIYGKNIEDKSVLYLILCIFGLNIVNYILIQSDLNNFA